MVIPEEYQGREQTFLKHRVLRDYLVAWGHKLGSWSRYGAVRLWHVDCFAGPWNQRDADLADTSIAIGLRALEEAAATWREQGSQIDIGALFVEPNDEAFARLGEFLARRAGTVQTHAFHGEFGDHVGEIQGRIGQDPAFIFVDPTGWRGAAMRFIAPLMGARRDVMVNVMFNHVNRFKDDPRAFLREQMTDFFGLAKRELPPHLDEEGLIELYRGQLKRRCGLRFAADLAIPHPTRNRTWFRLVVGGNSPAVLELFRDVERKVVGHEAGIVREAAARRRREQRTAQPELGLGSSNPDQRYQALRSMGIAAVEGVLREELATGPRPFADVWPVLLERLHVTRSDAARRTFELVREGRVVASALGPRERTIKDPHVVSLFGSS
jgi:three-Cys-motif partner protein